MRVPSGDQEGPAYMARSPGVKRVKPGIAPGVPGSGVSGAKDRALQARRSATPDTRKTTPRAHPMGLPPLMASVTWPSVAEGQFEGWAGSGALAVTWRCCRIGEDVSLSLALGPHGTRPRALPLSGGALHRSD